MKFYGESYCTTCGAKAVNPCSICDGRKCELCQTHEEEN